MLHQHTFSIKKKNPSKYIDKYTYIVFFFLEKKKYKIILFYVVTLIYNNNKDPCMVVPNINHQFNCFFF